MERLGGILQKTATACCWFRRRLSTGGARASSPERPRALLAIQEVANKSVLWSWVACACRSCGIRSPTTNVYDSPNARAWPRTRPRRADAAAEGTACRRVDGQARGHAPRRSTSPCARSGGIDSLSRTMFWIALVMPGVSVRTYAPCGPTELRGRISTTSSTSLMSPVSTFLRACGTIS